MRAKSEIVIYLIFFFKNTHKKHLEHQKYAMKTFDLLSSLGFVFRPRLSLYWVLKSWLALYDRTMAPSYWLRGQQSTADQTSYNIVRTEICGIENVAPPNKIIISGVSGGRSVESSGIPQLKKWACRLNRLSSERMDWKETPEVKKILPSCILFWQILRILNDFEGIFRKGNAYI